MNKDEPISCSFRLPRWLYDTIRAQADMSKRSMAKQIEYMLEQQFKADAAARAELEEHAYEAL